MTVYDIVITDPFSSEPIIGLSDARDIRYSLYLNRPAEMSCVLSMRSEQAQREFIQPGTRELLIYRDNVPVETVFALNRVSVVANDTDESLQINATGIMAYLSDALVYGNASARTGTQIPWTLIDTYQNRAGAVSDIFRGATVGTPQSRTKIVEQDAAILDTIIELSETGDGFDFNIDSNRRYNEWHPKRGAFQGIVLEYGTNVSEFTYDESTEPGEIVTDVRAFGTASSGPPRSAFSSTARSIYGRREASISYNSENENAVETDAQLQAFANNAVISRSAPLIIPSMRVTPNHPSISLDNIALGDSVIVRARLQNYASIDAVYRIIAIHVELDDNFNESLTLELNPE